VNGSKLKIWQCYSGLTQQTWTYNAANHLALANGLCLDITDGNLANGNQLQVWQCAPGNPNQVWTSSLSGGQRRRSRG
jgi:hypothetical protein